MTGKQEAAEAHQARAMATIAAIFAGGDLAAEALELSNEFTDRQAARVTAWRRPPRPKPHP